MNYELPKDCQDGTCKHMKAPWFHKFMDRKTAELNMCWWFGKKNDHRNKWHSE